MGTDTPLACLSDKPQLLFNYFKQMFAQVTNPAIDPIREDLVMSLYDYIGREGQHPRGNAAALPHAQEAPSHRHQLEPRKTSPRQPGRFSGHHAAHALPRGGRREAPARRPWTAFAAAPRWPSSPVTPCLILSDRGVDEEYAPIPELLALSAVHNHLVREKTRNQVALIVETGEPREVMHFALLMGYGASAINPYLAIENAGGPHAKGYFPRTTRSKRC
jgi:glutamate synthase (NADPH) large chain